MTQIISSYSYNMAYSSSSYLKLFFLLLLLTLIFPFSTPLEFSFPSISHTNPSLITEGNVTFLDSNQLQLTTNKTDQIGRVRFSEKFHLWQNSSGELREADFVTSFSFTVHSADRAPGDGLTFFLAQPPFLMPSVTDGSAIGLVSHEERNRSAYPFVAVEFDTFGNDFDPPDRLPHVGIDSSSLISDETVSWACDIKSVRVYNATVSYFAKSRNLSVSFNGYIEDVRIQQSLNYEIRLADHLPEWVSFGFSAANGLFTSKHVLLSWSFNSKALEIDDRKISPVNPRKSFKMVVGLSVGVGLLALALGSIVLLVLWRKKRMSKFEKDNGGDLFFDVSMDDDFEKISVGARKFSYDELLGATNNFSKEKKLGEGGFGDVYRGSLNGASVAIKRVSKWSTQGVKEYASEVKIVSRLRHKNLVQLLGWCHLKGDLLLVYEFVPNGSLDSHLFGTSSLPWEARYNIAQGLASALRYLHEECDKCVLHRDVKPSNIVLDLDFNAKLGDFGLARLVDHGKGAQTTMLAGTLGYLAPECVMTGKASRESDVYSFGVVALEIACGKRAIGFSRDEEERGLVEWVWSLHEKEKVLEAADPRLDRKFDAKQMVRLILVGLWCSHPDWGLRPSIKQASHVLDFQAPLPIFPGGFASSNVKFGHGSSNNTSGTSSENTRAKSFSSSDNLGLSV